jgi:hypothetical protein
MFYLTFIKFIPLLDYEMSNFKDLKNYIFISIHLTSFLTFFFKYPCEKIYFYDSEKSPNIYKFSFFFLCILFNLGVLHYYNNFVNYIIQNIFISYALIFFLLFYLISRSYFLITILFLLTFYTYSNYIINRTFFLLVPLSFALINFFKIKNYNNLTYKKIFFLFFCFLIFLILGDLYKTIYISGFDGTSTWYIFNFDINAFVSQLLNSRYLESNFDILNDYFSTMFFLTDNFKNYGGNFISQLVSFVKPSFFFPDKDVTNISTLLYLQGYNANSLYFEIFLEASYNLGLVGVFIYYFLFLATGNFFYKSIMIFQNSPFLNFIKINYFLFILILFLLLRGPIIFIINFFFISIFILLILVCLRFLRKIQSI